MIRTPSDLVRSYLDTTTRHIDRVRDGNQKETFRCVLGDGRTVYVQLGGADLRHEIALHRDLASRSVVPVPAMLANGCSSEQTFFITEAVPGVRLTDVLTALDAAACSELCRTLGRYLGCLHNAYAFDGHGYVVEQDGALVVDRPRTARTVICDLLDRGLSAFPSPLADLRRSVHTSLTRTAIPADEPATLYPWDFRPGNMRWQDGAVSGLLDWGTPMAAPAAVGVAKAMYVTLDWFELTAYRSAFLAGYQSVRTLSVDGAYWQFASVLAVVRSAVDSQGAVTRPFHPMADEPTAFAFHRGHLEGLLTDDVRPPP